MTGPGWEGVRREDGYASTLAMHEETLSEILSQGPSEREDRRPRESRWRTIRRLNRREWRRSDGDVGDGTRGDE